MKTPLAILAVILLLSLVLNGYLLWDRKRVLESQFADNAKLNEVIQSRTAEIQIRNTIINAIQKRRVNDSLFFRSREKGLKIDLDRYKAKASQVRPQVQVKIDSFPDLRQFLELQDSIIVKQDSLIRAQDLFCAAQISDFNEILALHQQKFTAQQQISEAWMETAAEARKDAVKEKRKKNFFKITSGILTAGIIFLAVRE